MPTSITMPALSPTMTEGTLAKWMVKEGDIVKSGDVIAEIETDKATMELEAVDEGTIGRIVVPAGTENVAVNAVIALLLNEGEDAGALKGAAAPATKPATAPQPTASPAPAPKVAGAQTPSPKTEIPSAPRAEPPHLATADGGRVIASPLARRMAEKAGLQIAAVTGSGPHGRIVKADIEAALVGGGAGRQGTVVPFAQGAATAPKAQPAAVPQGLSEYTEVPHSQTRKVIARRLTEAVQTIPHFYLTVDCEIDRLMDLRKDLNARGEKDGFKLSVNDFVIRAAALSLRKMPEANAAWSDTATLLFKTVDVSVAVATKKGLITPIVRNADQKGLAAISAEVKDLASRAQDGKLAPEEYQGGTFSVSNLGMYGIKSFTSIINPPQGMILSVGAGEQRPVVKDGALSVATVMTVTLAVDHRVVDGAMGAQWLGIFKRLIEDPMTMML